jgi:hypothetical protein
MKEKIYLDKNIWYIKNFIDNSLIDLLMQECLVEKNWDNEEGKGHWYNNIFPVFDKNLQILFDINKKISEIIDDKNTEMRSSLSILRYKKTDNEYSMQPHHDKTETNTKLGIVLYLNDDFEGGEIVYINQNIFIKPEKGMLVCHSALPEYMHGVKAVTKGIRYVITAFAYEKNGIIK